MGVLGSIGNYITDQAGITSERRRQSRTLYEAMSAGVPNDIASAGAQAGKPSSAIISEWRSQQREQEGTAIGKILNAPASTAAAMEPRGMGGRERTENVMQAAGLTPRDSRQVYQAAELQTRFMEKKGAAQNKKDTTDAARVRLQEMTDSGAKPKLSDYLAAGMTATEALRAARPEKASEGERTEQRKQAHRAQFAKAFKAPDTPEWQYWIQEGGERPGKAAAEFPTAADVAGDFEGYQKPLAQEQTPGGIAKRKEEALDARDTTPVRVLTPQQVADSARVLTKNMTRMKQDVVGGGSPVGGADPEMDALESELQGLIDEFKQLRDSE